MSGSAVTRSSSCARCRPFYDKDRHPRWNAMAMFCLERRERMRPNELQFVEDMAGRTLSYEPSEKQGRWLLAIFIKLGGMRQ
jgi:hypothetical protein